MSETFAAILNWLEEQDKDIKYGNIHLSIIKHQGKITKIVKSATKVEKMDKIAVEMSIYP